MIDSSKDRPSHPDDWTLWLGSAALTPFGPVMPDNYDGALRDFWQRQLRGNPGSILDIGCGNGALCWIADELLNRPVARSRITGVDFADIDPFRVLDRDRNEHPGVDFRGKVFAEALPFPDSSFDLIISQYGIEYSDLRRSIPEAARVLRPAGRMVFVMHDRNSEVVKLTTAHLDDMKKVWSFNIHGLALDLHELRRGFRTLEERGRSSDYRALTSRLNELTQQARALVQGYAKKSQIHHYMNRLMAVFAYPDDPANADPGRVIAETAKQFASHIRKIEHLEAAALSDQELSDLPALVEAAGCAVTLLEQFALAPGVPIGTTLVAVRDLANVGRESEPT